MTSAEWFLNALLLSQRLAPLVSHNIIYNPQSVYVETQVDMAQHTAKMVVSWAGCRNRWPDRRGTAARAFVACAAYHAARTVCPRLASLAELIGHSHPTAVAQVATRAQVKRLILIHHSPIEALNYSADLEHVRQIFPLIEVGYDGIEVDF